ncbi:LOW QUALITY PROTEIN: disease resistance protein At4g27190-like [Durio zibethinus]|uniref:LOW QUALITY PROTEIN: disease resistance protein At4g27190-like n=1 Tax=Durio zibethinus TaxID=66656 RepID=A0A6P6A9N1_DURZI|nr:LOW QUALITY PROTEIN: disease resistance protein At4g27190-like [Durio zibethinus]
MEDVMNTLEMPLGWIIHVSTHHPYGKLDIGSCVGEPMRLGELPQLIRFGSKEKTSKQEQRDTGTKPLFNERIVFPSLKELRLSRINIKRIWPIQLATSYLGPSLRILIVHHCGNLKYLLSHSVAKCLVQLRHVEIIDCWSMIQVVEAEEKLYEIGYMISFPSLISLEIRNLPELTGFYSGNDSIVFPSLEEVTVKCCPNMKIFCNGVLETPKLRNVQISEGEHIDCRVGDLNTTIRQFYIEKLKKRDKAESEGELKVEVGISSKQGEEAVQQEAMLKEKKIEILLSSPIDMSSPAIKYEKDQRAAPEISEEINEAEGISERDPEFGKIQHLSDDVEVTRERTSTPVEKPLSATEHVPSLAAENLEIIPDENEGTFSSHEIEMEAAHRQKEKGHNVFEETEKVSQPSEPAPTLTLSTPSTREIVEPVAAIPSTKDDNPVMDEAEAEILRVPAMTNIEHSVSKILECMGSTETVRRLAVYGVCGVGKSSVLRALVNNPETKHKFDLIIWVTVSKYWSRRKIQDQIIQQLPPASSNAEPFQVLKGKKFLLLLDDVWEWIDLHEMGIPDPSQENGSMMILSTRELKVCHDMGKIGVIEIEPVSKEEAWTLFHEQVGGVVDLPSINYFAKGIVEGCCGLPLLIIVTGRALADEENVTEWKHAFNEFSEPGRDVKSRMEDLIQLLKFSFYRLKSRSLKSCFLYCALFSEDQQMNTSEFVDYCIQEGLIAGSWSDAFERGHDILDALLRALLLETTEGGRLIKMRDVMRDLALGILSSDTELCQFLQRTYSKPLKPEDRSSSTSADGQYLSRVVAGLTEPPTEKEWEQSEIMFLMNDKLSALPDKPSCPKLVTLFLQELSVERNYQLRVLPDLFFHNMPLLKLLNLSKTRIKYLPKSISNLKGLETLILRDCERLVKLRSEVGSLKHLQVLDLRGTEIIELPKEIAQLNSLSYLEVSFYGSSTNSKHAKLPPGLISELEALETLSISVYPGDNWWNKSVESFIKEVINLKLLTSLSFYFPEVKFLEQFLGESASWKEESLTEFKFVVGADIKFNASRVPQYVELNYGLISSQCLRFVNSEKIPDAIVNVLARCTAFYLDHHLDVHRLSEFGIGNIKKLKYCIISECPDLETIVDSEEGTESVSCLEYLSIHYSWSLTSIWKGVVPKGSFAALRTLSLYACPKLTYVFKSSMLQFISNLEELLVDDCEAIEKIISMEEVKESCCISLKSLTLQYLPKLVHIWEDAQTRLLFEYISVYDCPQLKQICKDLELKQTLKEIRAEKDWWDELVWEENGVRLHFEAIFTPIGEGDVHSS